MKALPLRPLRLAQKASGATMRWADGSGTASEPNAAAAGDPLLSVSIPPRVKRDQAKVDPIFLVP